jgi:peptide/nickel transport system ATP-binding protein
VTTAPVDDVDQPAMPSGPGTEPALSLSGVSVSYAIDGRFREAVQDISLEVARGSTLGLVGESGSGKTTVAQMIMRSLPSAARVDSGSVCFHGRELSHLSEEEFRPLRWNKLAMVFQNALEALNPVLSVGHQLVDALIRRAGLAKSEAQGRAEAAIVDVGLEARWMRAYPHQLSGGMRQRVMIALALACRPELIIADEPTTALDVVAQQEIIDLLKGVITQSNSTLIVISHDLHMIGQVCDQVGVMYAGKIVEYGSRADVLERPRHPYTRALLGAYPSVVGPLDAIRPLMGDPPSLGRMPSGCRFHPRCVSATELCGRTTPAPRGQTAHWDLCHYTDGDLL